MASEQLTITTRVVDRASQQLQQLRRELQQLEEPRNIEVRASIRHELREFERELERVVGARREAEVAVRVNRDEWDTFRRELEEPIDTEVRVDISRGERAAQELGQRFERELRQAVDVVSRVTINVQGGPGSIIGRALGGGIPGLGLTPLPVSAPPFAFVGPRLAPPTALPFVPRDAPFVGPLPAPPTSAPAQRALVEQALAVQLAELDEPIAGAPPAIPPRAAFRAREEENLQAFLSQFEDEDAAASPVQFTLASGQEIDLQGLELTEAGVGGVRSALLRLLGRDRSVRRLQRELEKQAREASREASFRQSRLQQELENIVGGAARTTREVARQSVRTPLRRRLLAGAGTGLTALVGFDVARGLVNEFRLDDYATDIYEENVLPALTPPPPPQPPPQVPAGTGDLGFGFLPAGTGQLGPRFLPAGTGDLGFGFLPAGTGRLDAENLVRASTGLVGLGGFGPVGTGIPPAPPPPPALPDDSSGLIPAGWLIPAGAYEDFYGSRPEDTEELDLSILQAVEQSGAYSGADVGVAALAVGGIGIGARIRERALRALEGRVDLEEAGRRLATGDVDRPRAARGFRERLEFGAVRLGARGLEASQRGNTGAQALFLRGLAQGLQQNPGLPRSLVTTGAARTLSEVDVLEGRATQLLEEADELERRGGRGPGLRGLVFRGRRQRRANIAAAEADLEFRTARAFTFGDDLDSHLRRSRGFLRRGGLFGYARSRSVDPGEIGATRSDVERALRRRPLTIEERLLDDEAVSRAQAERRRQRDFTRAGGQGLAPLESLGRERPGRTGLGGFLRERVVGTRDTPAERQERNRQILEDEQRLLNREVREAQDRLEEARSGRRRGAGGAGGGRLGAITNVLGGAFFGLELFQTGREYLQGGELRGGVADELSTTARAAAVIGEQQAVTRRTGPLLGGTVSQRDEAIAALGQVTGLDEAGATRYLSILAQGDPRLVDNAPELYLLVRNALTEQQLGNPPTPAQVLDAIQQGLREEGGFFSLAESGGFPEEFVDAVSVPTLAGAFTRAAGLPDQLRIQPDDVRGGTALYRSVSAEAIEDVLGQQGIRTGIRQEAITNELQNFSNQITLALGETDNETLRQSLRAVQGATRDALFSSDFSGLRDTIGTLFEAIGQVFGDEQGALTPTFRDIRRAGERIRSTPLTEQSFERATGLLRPLVRPFDRERINFAATGEGRVVAADFVRLQIDEEQEGLQYGRALRASGIPEEEVNAEAGLSEDRIAILRDSDPGELTRIRQAALDRLIRRREQAEREARRSARISDITPSGFGDLYGPVDRFSQDLLDAEPIISDVTPSGFDALYGPVDEFSVDLATARTQDRLYGRGRVGGPSPVAFGFTEGLRALQGGLLSGQGAGRTLAQAGGLGFGAYVGTAIGGPLGGVAGQFAGQALTPLLEEANEWLSGIFGNTAPDRPGLRPEERAFGPQIGSVAAPGATPIVSEITVNINGNVMGEIDIQEAVQQGVVDAVNEAGALGQLNTRGGFYSQADR